AAVHLECAAGGEEGAQREPEELRLRHEAQEALRPEAEAERPRVEIRDVPGREHVAAVRRQVLAPVRPVAEHEVDERPRAERDERVERRGPGRTCHRPRVSPKRARALWWRVTWRL